MLNIHDMIIPQFIKTLESVNNYFDKAQKHADLKKYDVNVLLNERLTPDQWTFTRQIQVACDTAKGTAARLAGKVPPVHEDTEKTIPELRNRIQKVVSYLKTFKAEDFQGWEERHIDIWFKEGKYLDGFECLTQMALPNFYFHLTTAYAILRSRGVDVGKMDFLGSLPFKDKK